MNQNIIIASIISLTILISVFFATIYLVKASPFNTCVQNLESSWISNADATRECANAFGGKK